MEDSFGSPHNDPFESPLSPGFFDSLLDDLANDNVEPLSLPQQNHHEVQQGNDDDDDDFLKCSEPNIFIMSNPILGDSSNSNVNLPPAQPQQNHDGVQKGNDPFPDSMVEYQCEHNNFSFEAAGNTATDASNLHGDQCQPEDENLGSQNDNVVIPLDHWPPTPVPLFCSCCQVLREIVYTNGTVFEKLEIHGRLGIISHAIYHHKNINGDPSNNIQYEMIDFCHRSILEIKHYLEQYCQERDSAGFLILQDPMSTFYDALCTGFDWAEDLNEVAADTNQNNSVEEPQVEETDQEADNGTSSKPPLAAQRERAGKMGLSDFSDYFHLPIGEAAKKVNLCPTVVKKICRKGGLGRWPFRKLKSILKQIEMMKGALKSGDAMTKARAQAEINRLQQEIIYRCGGIAPTGIPNPV